MTSKMNRNALNSRILLFVAVIASLQLAPACLTLAQGPFQPPPPPTPFPFVSPLFGDDMVLQRGKADTIWGWSEPGDKVTVQIGDNTATAVAQANRRWEVRSSRLPPAALTPSGSPAVKRSKFTT